MPEQDLLLKKYFQKLENVWKCSIIPVPDSKCSLFSITKFSSLLMLQGRSLLPRKGSHLHGLPTCFLWLRSIIKCLIKLHFCSYEHVFQRFTSLVGYDRRSFKNCFALLCHQCLFKILYQYFIQITNKVITVLNFIIFINNCYLSDIKDW